jgi:hypothetical protein
MKKIVSVILVALMMLLTAAMVVSASEKAAEETMEKNIYTTEKVKEEVKENAPEISENKTAEPVKAEGNETKTETKPAPGFESIFAITGLLAVAVLVLGRRE